MKKFIHAIQTADFESLEIWLSENAMQIVNTPQATSGIPAYQTHNPDETKEIYPLVLAWKLLFPQFDEKHVLIFKRLIAAGADFQCLKVFQNNRNLQQNHYQSQPLLHRLCENYIKNIERNEKKTFEDFRGLRFHDEEITPQVKQQKREHIIWIIKTLLANNFDINETNAWGHSVLSDAVRQGCSELISLFLENSANIHYIAQDSSTALHHFMQGVEYFDDPVKFLKQLLEYGIGINTSNHAGQTPFSLLISHAPEKVITFFPILQRYGLQLDITLKQAQQEQGYAELLQYNQPDNFLFLIKQGLPVPPEIYLTAFFNYKDHQELQDYLFEQGNIATLISSNTGDTALHMATSPEIIQRLLTKGANIHHRNKKGETPLLTLMTHLAFLRAEQAIACVELFLLNKANITDIDEEGNGVLHRTVNNLSLLTSLIKAGASVNVCNKASDSPLHLALRHGINIEVALCLINHDAKIHCINNQKEIPLEGIEGYFCDSAAVKLIIVLLKALPPNYLPKNYQKLLEYGCRLNNIEILQKLYDQGFNPHSPFGGELLLKTAHWAMQHDNDVTLAWLLDHGVDIQYETKNHNTSNTVWIQLIQGFSHASCQIKTQSECDIIIKRFFKIIEKLKKFLTPKEFTQSIQSLLNFLLDSHWNLGTYWILIRSFIQSGIMIEDKLTLERLISSTIAFNDAPFLWEILENQHNQPEFNQLLEIAAGTAVYYYRSNMLTRLITYGWDINKPLKIGYQNEKRPLEYFFSELQSHCYTQTEISEAEQLACIHHLLDQSNLNINVIFEGLHYDFENQSYHCLHWAIFKGWDEVVRRLLNPPFSVSPNLMSESLSPSILAIDFERFTILRLLLEKGADPNAVSKKGSILQCAIRKKQENSVELLLKHKADPNTWNRSCDADRHFDLCHFIFARTNNKYPLLFYAVAIANPRILTLLLEHSAKTVFNLRITTRFGDWDLLSYALSKDNSHEIAPQLLPFISIGVEHVRQALKFPTISVELLALFFSKLSESEQLQLRPLLTVLSSNNKRLDIIKWLLTQNKQFIYQKDFMGRNALYYIVCTALSNETHKTQALELFKLLSSYDIDPYTLDCEGQTVANYAFYNGAHEAFGLRCPLSQVKEVEFIRLKKQLFLTYREFEIFNGNLNKCAFKLIQLFGTAEQALRYLEKYYSNEQQNFQPIHNLCLFQLPMQGNWETEQWGRLIIEIKFEFTKVLHLAPQIEMILGKVPTSLDEAFKAARKITYHRENENPTLAALFKTYFIHEIIFLRVLNEYTPKSEDYMPDIEVDGTVFGQPRYFFKKLPKEDKRGWILGELTHCCQSVGNAGESYAMHGMTSPYSGFYAVFKRNKERDIQRYVQLLSYTQKVKTVNDFIALIPKANRSQKEKYLNWCKDKAKELHLPLSTITVLDHLKTHLQQMLLQTKEGELIAQLWAWCADDNRSFVFDSWERLRPEDDGLCEPFIKEAANKLIQQHGFQRILLGQYGNSPRNLSFEESNSPAYPKDYFGVRDSQQQWLIKEMLAPVEELTRQEKVVIPLLHATEIITHDAEIASNKNNKPPLLLPLAIYKDTPKNYFSVQQIVQCIILSHSTLSKKPQTETLQVNRNQNSFFYNDLLSMSETFINSVGKSAILNTAPRFITELFYRLGGVTRAEAEVFGRELQYQLMLSSNHSATVISASFLANWIASRITHSPKIISMFILSAGILTSVAETWLKQDISFNWAVLQTAITLMGTGVGILVGEKAEPIIEGFITIGWNKVSAVKQYAINYFSFWSNEETHKQKNPVIDEFILLKSSSAASVPDCTIK